MSRHPQRLGSTGAAGPDPTASTPITWLSPIERELANHAAAGTAFDLSRRLDHERRIRPDVLYELCVGTTEPVHAKGVRLIGAVIDQPLDLESASLRVPLTLERCELRRDVILRGAAAPAVHVTQCRLLGRLDASRLRVGHLRLSRTTVDQPVLLAGATIERDLELDGARLSAEDGGYPAGRDPQSSGALVADGLRVGGALLADGVEASGAIRLSGATVGGNVEFSGARLIDPDEGSLMIADQLHVGGGVLLTDGFRATGAVRLAGATIEGQLSLDGAAITGRDGQRNALVADGLRVGGDALLHGGFEAAAAIRLAGATIGGGLELDGARISGADVNGDAVVAHGLSAGGDVYLGNGFQAAGAVQLAGANVNGNLELDGARVTGADLHGDAVVADHLRVYGSVFLGDGFEAVGAVRLAGAVVDSQLSLVGAKVRGVNHAGDAVVADGIRVGGDAFLHGGLEAAGAVRLVGAIVAGNLVLDGARVSGVDAEGNGVVANRLHVGGDLLLREGFDAVGTVCLTGATAGGRLSLIGATTSRLILTGVHCAELADDESSWPAEGRLALRGFRFTSLAHDPGWEQRLVWVRRQGFVDWSPDPYEQLAVYYAGVGDEDAACRIRIAKDDDELTHLRLTKPGETRVYRFWRRPFGWLVGYGYRRNRAGWLLVATLLLAGLVFRIAEADGAMTPNQPPEATTGGGAPAEECGRPYPCFSSFVYGADVVLPIIDLGQDGAWRPIETDDAGPVWIWARWAFITIGWALASVFAAAFTGLVQRT
jgi:hypothetical protein